MNVIITKSVEEFDREGALRISRQALKKPDSFFGLATGDTTKAIYRLTAELCHSLGVDYSRCKTCNLDDYVGLPASDSRSCRYRINEILLDRINIPRENTYVPNGMTEPPERELDVFRETIERFGGIDLLVLGVGTNGHIGFNEPGTPFDRGFRLAPISPETRRDKAAFFGGEDKVPKFGITMGIRDIMMAREILLVAKGRSKAEVVRRVVHGPLGLDMPATVTRLHPALTVIADPEAAALLERGVS
jgi:glucosamine-6-phosphate deaminase